MVDDGCLETIAMATTNTILCTTGEPHFYSYTWEF